MFDYQKFNVFFAKRPVFIFFISDHMLKFTSIDYIYITRRAGGIKEK